MTATHGDNGQVHADALDQFIHAVLSRADLQFRLSSCQSLGEIVALARVVGLELEVDQIRERIHQLDRSCPHWPWSGQSQRVLQSFLNDISSLATPRSSP